MRDTLVVHQFYQAGDTPPTCPSRFPSQHPHQSLLHLSLGVLGTRSDGGRRLRRRRRHLPALTDLRGASVPEVGRARLSPGPLVHRVFVKRARVGPLQANDGAGFDEQTADLFADVPETNYWRHLATH